MVLAHTCTMYVASIVSLNVDVFALTSLGLLE